MFKNPKLESGYFLKVLFSIKLGGTGCAVLYYLQNYHPYLQEEPCYLQIQPVYLQNGPLYLQVSRSYK